MRTLRTLLTVLALALAVPALIAGGAAASGDDVIDDCADDGVIDGRYSDEELREAERDLPSDVDEYTDCREAIRGELGNDGGGSGGPGGSGGGQASDPSLVTQSGAVAGSRDDVDALNELTDGGRGADRDDAPSIDIGGREISPGAGGKVLGLSNGSNTLPTSMLSALLLLALAGVAGTVLLVRRHGLPAPVAARVGRLSTPAFLKRVRIPGLPRR